MHVNTNQVYIDRTVGHVKDDDAINQNSDSCEVVNLKFSPLAKVSPLSTIVNRHFLQNGCEERRYL